MKAMYLTGDLLFSSRVAGVAKQASAQLRTIGSVAALLQAEPADGDLVILDLTFAGLDVARDIPLIKQRFENAKLVAYGPHVHAAKLQAAAESGADLVLTRGQFDSQMASLLAG